MKEEFIITNNGRPVARVVPLGERPGTRVGFLPPALAREVRIPDDFDEMGADAIADLFETSE